MDLDRVKRNFEILESFEEGIKFSKLIWTINNIIETFPGSKSEYEELKGAKFSFIDVCKIGTEIERQKYLKLYKNNAYNRWRNARLENIQEGEVYSDSPFNAKYTPPDSGWIVHTSQALKYPKIWDYIFIEGDVEYNRRTVEEESEILHQFFIEPRVAALVRYDFDARYGAPITEK